MTAAMLYDSRKLPFPLDLSLPRRRPPRPAGRSVNVLVKDRPTTFLLSRCLRDRSSTFFGSSARIARTAYGRDGHPIHLGRRCRKRPLCVGVGHSLCGNKDGHHGV